jgi:S1-C subfamily serine protease
MQTYRIQSFLLIVMLLALSGCVPTEQTTSEGQPQPAASANQPAQVAQTAPTPTSQQPASDTSPNQAASTAADLSQQSVIAAIENTLQNIHDRVGPSVVNIRVVQRQTRSTQPDPGIPDFPFALPEQPEQPEEFFAEGQGSGFVWDTQGHIVTNNHVVQDADRISVTFADGTVAEAELIGTDRDSDLAVVQVNLPPEQLRPIEVVSSETVHVGELIAVLGNPFGLENTLTVGFISALGRSLPVQMEGAGPTYSIPDVIQTDAAVNPGNSGGAMVNDQGQLIGVPSAIRSPVRASVGVGFAIPSTIVQKVVPSLIERGTYSHPWLGISGQSFTPEIARAMGLDPGQQGALVIDVTEGGPADEAGLRGSDRQVTIDGIPMRVGGDVITQFNDRPVNGFDDLIAYLARYTTVGDQVTLTILRDGQPRTITVPLEARPEEGMQQPQASRSDTQAWLGIQGTTIIPEIAQAMNYALDQTGVLVSQVEAGSPADEAGLRGSFKNVVIQGERLLIGGDIITAINGQPVADIEALRTFMMQANPGDTITLTILRGDEEITAEVTLAERPE